MYTRYMNGKVFKNHPNAEQIAAAFVKFFQYQGVPNEILSDQGKELNAAIIRELYRLLHITKHTSCAYRPQSHGLIERSHRTINVAFRCLALDFGNNFNIINTHFDTVISAHNSFQHTATKISPNLLHFGREIRIPGALIDSAVGPHITDNVYIRRLTQSMSKVHTLVNATLEKYYVNLHKRANKNRMKHGLMPHDMVLIRRGAPGQKLVAPYFGPASIIDINEKVALVKFVTSGSKQIIHVDRLKIYHYRPGQILNFNSPIQGKFVSFSQLPGTVGPAELDPISTPSAIDDLDELIDFNEADVLSQQVLVQTQDDEETDNNVQFAPNTNNGNRPSRNIRQPARFDNYDMS